MFAKYVVMKVNGKVVPYIVSPMEVTWDRLVDSEEVDMRKVLGAGFITWTEGNSDEITCFGEGFFHRSINSTRKTIRKSRGEEDAALFKELLSKPLGYVVLNLNGMHRPIIVYPHDNHDDAVLRYQVYAHRHVVSAGMVDFGMTTGKKARCSGSFHFESKFNPLTAESKGAEDVKLMRKFFSQEYHA